MDAMARKRPKAQPKEPPDDVIQIPVRMTGRTKERIEADAKANFRTLNMHILWLIHRRLEDLARENGPSSP